MVYYFLDKLNLGFYLLFIIVIKSQIRDTCFALVMIYFNSISAWKLIVTSRLQQVNSFVIKKSPLL